MVAAGAGFLCGIAATIGGLVIIATMIWKDIRG